MTTETAITTQDAGSAILPADTEPLPADRHPAAVYLAGLTTESGRVTMRSTLDQVARMLGQADAESTPWHLLRFQHVAALRARLVERYAPAAVNKSLSAVRGTLKAAWRLGLMGTDDYLRAVDVPNVKGSRLPASRALDAGEIRALFTACQADTSAAGSRDAAAFALLFGAGLRRSEAVAVQVADYEAETGTLTVIGKGNKQRAVHCTNGGADAIADWMEIRGTEPGPMLAPVSQAGQVAARGMTAQALMMRLKTRAKQAGIRECSPHDLRRTFVSELLDAGADLSSVQRLAGHASIQTTARYDRRPEAAKRRAASMIHVPYRKAS